MKQEPLPQGIYTAKIVGIRKVRNKPQRRIKMVILETAHMVTDIIKDPQ